MTDSALLPGGPDTVGVTEDHAIAIIGRAGRFPGASRVAEFWQNILGGVESIGQITDDELLAAGVDPTLAANPNYVKFRPYLDDIRGFDAEFFGYSPRDAMIADPQQRIFLECAWEALEDAGYGAPSGRGRVGVFAGVNISMYFQGRLISTRPSKYSVYEVVIGNDKDALTTMVSYKLNLTGPSVAVQTFCSSSLAAVHVACLSLRHGECDMALAGGVSIRVPDRVGYLYTEGGMESPDGHVRTFDKDARGGNFGDGAAVVLLKPLRHAIAHRDTVLAVIRGSAMTNDGARRFSFTAPSVVGQAQAVADAMADAGVNADDISYVEAHGTATELGDPIEVAALTRAYGTVSRRQYCLIGSVKTNVGHLDRAAGATGLIKIVESLRHEVIPGTLHYRSPNPEIDFANSPFYVAAEPTQWPRQANRPRIAGLNSLGMGGTNVHVIVQEPPLPANRSMLPRRWQVLTVSARSAAAVTQYCDRLAGYLRAHCSVGLADVAFTMQVGRDVFEHRRVAIADSAEAAAALLDGCGRAGQPLLARADTTHGRSVVFLAAGVGEHYPGMVATLYKREPVFRQYLDECQEILNEHCSLDVVGPLTTCPDLNDLSGCRQRDEPDLARLMGRADVGAPAAAIHDTQIAQPAVFAAEYALARTLMCWGITPSVLIGYSVGEYVAACLARVMSLPDALRLVTHRARLIAGLPRGAMLAVALTAADLQTHIPDLAQRGLDIATITTAQVVVAGPAQAAQRLADDLRAEGIGCRELETTHAFHSRMLEPAAAELTEWVRRNITIRPPVIPYISNVTGGLATTDVITDPTYWSKHMCSTVRFFDGLTTALSFADLAFIEIGVGKSLGAMLRGHPDCGTERWPLIVSTLPAAAETASSDATVTEALGRLWLAGVEVDWRAYHMQGAGRVSLPTYPFQRQSFWVDDGVPTRFGLAPASAAGGGSLEQDPLARLPEHQFLCLPVWRQTAVRPPAAATGPLRWLFYSDAGHADAIAGQLAERLRAQGHAVTWVRPGTAFGSEHGGFRVRPGDAADALALLSELQSRGQQPTRIVHLWTADPGGAEAAALPLAAVVRRGLHTLVALTRAAQEIGPDTWSLDIVSAGTQQVHAADSVNPERTSILGPCRMIPVECPGVTTRLIDIPASGPPPTAQLLAELLAEPVDWVVALREGRRWIPDYDMLDPGVTGQSMTNAAAPIRRNGVYLITGGLGGIGLALAERLAEHYVARLVLFGRTPVPPPDQWNAILADSSAASEVRRRLEALQRLQARGAEFVVVAGDVTEPADVTRAVATATTRFGALHGVLHTAGVPGVGLMALKSNADMDRVLAPKVSGTLVLAAALREVPVDFLALFSSVGSVLGAVGQADYCSANAFMDAFAHSGALPHCQVVSIGWGEWIWNGWTAGLAGYEPAVREHFQEYRRKYGLTFDEGWRALLRALASHEPHVFVSTQDFRSVVAGSRHFTLTDLKAMAADERACSSRHPRPELSTEFQAPQTEAERQIAGIWAEVLGMSKVGVDDNFFELGGSSLIGLEVVQSVRQALKLNHLPAHILYQAPTVRALAAKAAGAQPARVGNEASPGMREQDRAQQRRARLRAGRSA
jgi:acyl transferase domain-containing protein